MTDAAQVRAAFAHARAELGPIDILLNNIGQTARENYSEFYLAKPETLQFVVDVSLMTTLNCAARLMP